MLDGKKAENITTLDVRGRSTITDFVMLASGMSKPHIRALYEDVQQSLKHEGVPCYRRSGEVEGGWMVLDYVSVVVHLFEPEMREYYDLETLWSSDIKVPPQA